MGFVSQPSKPRYKPGQYAQERRDEANRWADDPVQAPTKPAGAPFRAELDMTELDERGQPMLTFTAKSTEIGGSHLCLRSRRMCYTGRKVILVIHLVDDEPVPIFGRVKSSDYDRDGLYLTRLELMDMPPDPILQEWLRSRGFRGKL